MPLPTDFGRDFVHAVDSQTGAAGAAVTATLQAIPGRTMWVVGYHISAGIVAAAVGGTLNIGPILDEATGTSKTIGHNYEFGTLGLLEVFPWPEPLPAPGPGQAITASIAAILNGPAISITLFGLAA